MNTQRTRVQMAVRRRIRRTASFIPPVPLVAPFPLVERIKRPKRGRPAGPERLSESSEGFTLIEVLVVIGIIAVLAAVVLVAVNPARQFKLARDSQRTSNVNAILNAVHQNIAEHKGLLVCEGMPLEIPETPALVKSDPSANEIDLAPCLIPDYLSSLPFDPSHPSAGFISASDYDTRYEIFRDENGRITASSTGELTPSISVTR